VAQRNPTDASLEPLVAVASAQHHAVAPPVARWLLARSAVSAVRERTLVAHAKLKCHYIQNKNK